MTVREIPLSPPLQRGTKGDLVLANLATCSRRSNWKRVFLLVRMTVAIMRLADLPKRQGSPPCNNLQQSLS